MTETISTTTNTHGLSKDELLEIDYYLRLTRTLEERLVALFRQTKVIGGVYRSLGQEGESVAAAYALEYDKGDVVQPLIRNLGSVLVDGAKPVDVLRQYMAKGNSPTRGREMNIHFGHPEFNVLGKSFCVYRYDLRRRSVAGWPLMS